MIISFINGSHTRKEVNKYYAKNLYLDAKLKPEIVVINEKAGLSLDVIFQSNPVISLLSLIIISEYE